MDEPDKSLPKQIPARRTGRLSDLAGGQFFLGREVSVRYAAHHLVPSSEHCHTQTKLALTLAPAMCVLRRRLASGDWREHRLMGRRICCVQAHVNHEVLWERDGDAIEIYLETRFLRRQNAENVTVVLSRESLNEADNDPVIWELAGAICFLCAEPHPDRALITNAAAMIATRLFQYHATLRPATSGQRFSAEQRERFDAYILTNIARSFHVPHLAKAMSLSAPHLTALCRNTTGKPPMEYVRECRLLKAHGMALAGNHRVREIARACGFYDASHLNREFKGFFRKSVRVVSLRAESSPRPIKS